VSDGKTLQLLDAGTGSIRTVAKTEKYLCDFDVSTDEAPVVFSEFALTGSDLMPVKNSR